MVKRSGSAGFPKQFEVHWVRFDPAEGNEVKRTRPAVVVSPNALNRNLQTVLVAPLTTTRRPWPTRVGITFAKKRGDVALDQLRCVDRDRLTKRAGAVPKADAVELCKVLVNMFQYADGDD
jgi:mRNA interferase MazF